ncbi:MAG: type II secretion system F family protein, partial [Candidatus Hadarchaeum sp.]
AVKIIASGFLMAVFTSFLLLYLGVPFLFLIVGGALAFSLTAYFVRTYPKRKLNSRVAEVNRVLPYALRHMSTQLSSGIGLPETITSVSRADYGALSEEFGRVISDMNKGISFEEALARLDDRVPSEPLRKTTRQIRRALRTGGDLAKVLNVLADEAAFEMRMKLRDYTQSLNMITMIYMFVSAVIPAMLMITMNISSGIGRAGISTQAAGVIYLILLPFLLFYFVIMIKKLEPRL